MAQLQSVLSFRNALQGGGARPNLFQVEIPTLDLPTGFLDDEWDSSLFSFTCKAAALPASNIPAIEVPVRGKTIKVPGDRTFDPWTVTVINTQGMEIRRVLEQWMEGIANQNEGKAVSTNPDDYQKSAVVRQYGRESTSTADSPDKGVKVYTFEGIYPSNISAIDMSYDNSDTISEFTVEFQVQYWYPGEKA